MTEKKSAKFECYEIDINGQNIRTSVKDLESIIFKDADSVGGRQPRKLWPIFVTGTLAIFTLSVSTKLVAFHYREIMSCGGNSQSGENCKQVL